MNLPWKRAVDSLTSWIESLVERQVSTAPVPVPVVDDDDSSFGGPCIKCYGAVLIDVSDFENPS